jgi:hypothetical protein
MHKCTNCEGCWLPLPFNAIEIEDHYKKSYFSGSVKEVYKGKVLSKDYISKVERIYPIKRGARILEVGAGFGFFANYASIKYSALVDVLEPNEKSKQYIKRKHPSVKVIGSTLNDLDPLYKFDIIFTIVLIAVVYLLNLIFIPKYGIIGTAISTSISFVIYNIGRLLFVYFAYKIHPFTIKQVYLILVFVLTLFSYYLIFPLTSNPIFNIFIQSCYLLFTFCFTLYFFDLEPNTKEYLHNAISSIKKKITE